MLYYGRDRRRRYRKILKRTLFATAAVTVFFIVRFLFFRSDSTSQDVVSVASIGNSLSANEIMPDTVFANRKIGLQNDSRYLIAQGNDEEKTSDYDKKDDNSFIEGVRKKKLLSYHSSKKPVRSFYQVLCLAHFYDKPTERSRRNDVIEYWNVTNESIKPLKEKDDFIYVVYRQPLGPAKKGWLRKKDLKKVTTSYDDNKE